MKSFEESITRFAICFIMGATLLAMLSVAALSQDGICQNNPQAPQCLVPPNGHQLDPAQPATWGVPNARSPQLNPQPAPDQSELHAEIDRQRHACELQAQHAYEECTRSGRSYCPLTACN